MLGAASLIKIGALFFAAVILIGVPNSKSAYAQKPGIGNFGRPSGSFHGRLGFRGGFDRGHRDFGPNIVVAPSVVPELPYYAPPPYYSLRCFLHRRVETPNGSALEPVYVC
jgi:hypothetical protein